MSSGDNFVLFLFLFVSVDIHTLHVLYIHGITKRDIPNAKTPVILVCADVQTPLFSAEAFIHFSAEACSLATSEGNYV